MRPWTGQALMAAGVVFLATCSAPIDETSQLAGRLRERAARLSPVPALPADPTNHVADDPAAARLGQALFFEPGLSGQGALSCATCHPPETAFADGKPVAVGLGIGTRNTPTVLDSAHERWLFRDGRADTLWSQALQPLEDPLEMGGSRAGVVGHLRARPALREAYEQVFGHDLADLEPSPEGVDTIFANVGKALAAYERLLLSGPSPFDRWVAGDAEALSGSARRGLEIFLGQGACTRCHVGPRLTDGEFHNLGVPPSDGGAPRDPGRLMGARRLREDPFESTGRFSDAREGARSLATRTLRVSGEDWGAFKTPSLRNVARTAPYMHAGQFATLHDVLRFYSTLEGAMTGGHHAESTLQPAHFTDGQIDDLVAFLESLTADDPPAALLAPAAP